VKPTKVINSTPSMVIYMLLIRVHSYSKSDATQWSTVYDSSLSYEQILHDANVWCNKCWMMKLRWYFNAVSLQ